MATDAIRNFEKAVKQIEDETGHRPYKALVSRLAQQAIEKEVAEKTEGRTTRTGIGRLGGVPLEPEERLAEGEVRFLLEEREPVQVRVVEKGEI